MSEIRQARPGCLRYLRHSNGIEYPYYFAHRSKQMASSNEDTRSRIAPKGRGWILGPAGVRALEVLEQLSFDVRRLSGVDSYWATIQSSGLWACTERLTVSVISSDRETAVELAGLDPQSTFSNMTSTEVAALRDRVANFVGELYSSADVRRLLGRGVRLLPCDWGMCFFRQQTSACGGNQFGPSAERRSPVVCRTCINFVATEKHRPYWRRRVEDCQRVLALRDIPEQVRRLVQLRMAEAKEVLSSISREVT